VAELELAVLTVTEWPLDLPVAADIADFLCRALPHAQLPLRAQWDEFLERAYAVPRFEPDLWCWRW